MATTGPIPVKDLTLYIDPAQDNNWVLVACAQNASMNVSREMIQKLCKKDGGGADFDYGLLTWTMSISGLYANDQTQGADAFLALLKAGTKALMRFTTGLTGDKAEKGTVLVQSIDLESSGAENAYASYSMNLQGTGVPTTETLA